MEEKGFMKRKLVVTLCLVLAMAVALVSCGGDSTAKTTPNAGGEQTGGKTGGMEGGTSLKFTTGGDQGTYYGYGGVLAGKVGETTSTTITAITSGGSQANIEAMQAGDAQIGFVQTDVGAYAYEGTRLFEDAGAYKDFSTIGILYAEQIQIVTLDPNIKTVADLKGKNVSIGAPGSGVYFNAVDVLAAYDMTVDDIKPTYQSFGDSTEALQDGKIDAAFLTAGAPTTAVTSLAATKKVYLVGFDEEHLQKLLADNPYYAKAVITGEAKEAYKLDSEVTTVSVGAVVIARDDVSEADVYNFLYAVFENKDIIAQAHAKGLELDYEYATSYGSVPYHPGAVKFFKEKGYEVKGK